MTEPEFIGVLHRRFNVDSGRLNEMIGCPDFAKRLFKECLSTEKAHSLLIDIFNGLISRQQELCDGEKAIVLEVKSWPDKPPWLDHMAHCFLDSELVRTGSPKYAPVMEMEDGR